MKRWKVSKANVTKKSLKCESYIRARMPAAFSTLEYTGTMLCNGGIRRINVLLAVRKQTPTLAFGPFVVSF